MRFDLEIFPDSSRETADERGGESHLEVSVDHEAVVHVLQAQDDFSRVETHLLLAEDAVLGQVVVQVTA